MQKSAERTEALILPCVDAFVQENTRVILAINAYANTVAKRHAADYRRRAAHTFRQPVHPVPARHGNMRHGVNSDACHMPDPGYTAGRLLFRICQAAAMPQYEALAPPHPPSNGGQHHADQQMDGKTADHTAEKVGEWVAKRTATALAARCSREPVASVQGISRASSSRRNHASCFMRKASA